MNFHQVTATSIQYLKEAHTSFLAIWYFKLLLKVRVCTQNIWFFNQCFKYGVFPNYVNLKTSNKSESGKIARVKGMRTWIYQDRKLQYFKRDNYNVYLKVIHSEITYRLNIMEFDEFDKRTRDKIDNIIQNKYIIQCSKLKRLIDKQRVNNSLLNHSNSNCTEHEFYERFVNLTDVEFTELETNLLKKGYSYNLGVKDSKESRQILAVECETACNNLIKTKDKYPIAQIITSEKFNDFPGNFSNDLSLIKIIKKKSAEHDIIFTRADKGKTVIAIKQEDYTSKTIDFLNSEIFQEIKRDPTDVFQKLSKDTIKHISIFTEYEKYKLILMNPQVPKLYSLIKLHKNNLPIRPVVSYVTAPTVKLSNKLIPLLTQYCNFKPKFRIKNSLELIQNIELVNIPKNGKFISFDVQNLFPSIPPAEVLILVEKLLISNNVNYIVKQDILDLLTICLDQNYFEFNNKIYICSEGLIMGNPLSPILAEIFMNNLEEIISNSPMFKNCLYWYRYVDDILVCYTGTDRQLKIFLEYINKLHKNIKFTIEMEQNKSICFLDLKINNILGKHEFEIFRKNSYTDITIHANSMHPFQHKMAAYNSFVHRLINTPMSEQNFNKELNIIKQISINNGYNPNMIDTILTKKQFKKAISLVYPENHNKRNTYRTISYMGKLSNKVMKHYKKHNINIAFRTTNTLGKFIKNNKTKTKKEQKSGIYQLNCGTCPKIYIGQTGRSFYKRIKEHKDCYRLQTNNSHYAKHLLEEAHDFNSEFKILHTENKSLKLNNLEILEINKQSKSQLLLNEQLDFGNSPLLKIYNT